MVKASAKIMERKRKWPIRIDRDLTLNLKVLGWKIVAKAKLKVRQSTGRDDNPSSDVNLIPKKNDVQK